jgi:hypothetical protein
MKEELIGFKTAKLAKEKEFSNGSNFCYTEYHSDFVYDGDENHPESYKSGDVHRDSMYNFNIRSFSSEHFTSYECPTQSLLQKWLRKTHNLHILIDRAGMGWYWMINNAITGELIIQFGHGDSDEECYENEEYYETYEEALEKGLQEGLNLVKI